MQDAFTEQMGTSKEALKFTVELLMQRGIPLTVILAAMGSTTGNLVGFVAGTDDRDKIGEIIDNMKSPMIEDAQAAHRKMREGQN